MWATGRCFDTLWGGRRRQQPGCSLWQVSSALLEQWCSPGWQDHSISELQTPPALQKQQAPHKTEGLSLKKEFSYREAWRIHFCWGWVTAAYHCSCFLDVMGFRICVLPSALWLRSGVEPQLGKELPKSCRCKLLFAQNFPVSSVTAPFSALSLFYPRCNYIIFCMSYIPYIHTYTHTCIHMHTHLEGRADLLGLLPLRFSQLMVCYWRGRL